MLVVSRVSIALLGAGDAGGCTSLNRRADEPDVRTTLARRNPRGCVADIGAVEGDTDHTDQRAHVVLSQARVGAGGAARSAIDAFLGASEEQLADVACRQRVQLDDLAKRHLRKCAQENPAPVNGKVHLSGGAAQSPGGQDVQEGPDQSVPDWDNQKAPTMRGALLGATLIATIANGIDLLGYSAATRFIVTGMTDPAFPALPALNPNQPNQRMPAPRRTSGTL